MLPTRCWASRTTCRRCRSPAIEFDGDGLSVVDMVSRAAGASKSEARRLVQQGGVSVNDRKISDANARLTRGDAIDGRVFLLRKGARQRFVIRLT